MSQNQNLQNALFLLRLGVFIVFFMWTIDKFLNPGHTAAVFAKFYLVGGLSETLAYVIGALQMAIVLMFVLGIKKQFSYGFILLMHLVSTLSTYEKYFDPWSSPNLLFFAAWPMLAACAALYLLRDEDTKWTVS